MGHRETRPYLACDDGYYKEWYMPPTDCPQCERTFNGSVTNTGHESPPVPDDLTICLFCDAVVAYTDDLKLRLATLAEIAQLLGDAYLDARLTVQLVEPGGVRE